MATSRKEKANGGLLQAAWDQIGDIGYYHNVSVVLRLLPTKRRGVFLIEAAAFRAVPGGKLTRAAKYANEWPNSSYDELGAALWSAVNQIDRLLMAENPHKEAHSIYDRQDPVEPTK